MRAFRRRSALPMAEAFDLGPAGQLAHTAKTWGTSVLATVASRWSCRPLVQAMQRDGLCCLPAAAACNSCVHSRRALANNFDCQPGNRLLCNLRYSRNLFFQEAFAATAASCRAQGAGGSSHVMAARKGEIIYTGWSRLDTEALILPLSRTARLDVVHVRGRVTPQADTRGPTAASCRCFPPLARGAASPGPYADPGSAGLPALQR